MKQKSPPKHKIIFVLTLFALLLGGILKSQAQNTSGIAISWDISVGCQTYSVVDDRKNKVFLEEIESSERINVCQSSTVKYTLTGLPTGASTVWSVSGGTKSLETDEHVTVNWTGLGIADVTFTITVGNVVVTKILKITIVKSPIASFFAAPFAVHETIFSCSYQDIYFTNNSDANGGTAIVSYYWDFGDNAGNPSTAANPIYQYTQPGEYRVTLTVTNECNCKSSISTRVIIKDKGFDLICPSVVCERQTATYSLPQEATEACDGYSWSVIGGTIIGSDHAPTVVVRWDHVDASGFGYVTFTPSQCSLPCVFPTTVRIPVMQVNGTIVGTTSLCLGEQGRYSLPQWPTTDFQWEIQGNNGGQLGTIFQTDQRNEIILTPTQAGTITLVATYNNTLIHCGGIAKLVINVKKPEPFVGASVICLGSSSTYTTVSTLPVTWTLKNSGGTTVDTGNNTNTFSYLFSTAGNFTLTVSGAGICDGQTKNITVAPALAEPVLYNPISVVCLNAPYTFSVLNPSANDQYEWQVDNTVTIIGSSTSSTLNVTFQGAGQIRVRRVQQSPVNCSSPFAVLDVVPLTIDADISNTLSVVSQMSACSNNYFTYNAIKTAGGIYVDSESTFEWSVVPSTAGSITSGQGTATVEVLWNNVTSPQPYTLQLVIKKCTATATINKTVLVSPNPVLSITGLSTICSGTDITFTVASTQGLLPSTVVNWSFSDGQNYDGAVGSLSTTLNFNNGNTTNSGYTVTATIVGANNCAGTFTATKNFTVTPGPKALASIFSGGNAFCEPLSINTVLTSATTGAATVTWYKNSTSTPPVGFLSSLTVTPAMGFGTYFFVASLNGCKTKSNSINVVKVCTVPNDCTVNPSPIRTFNAANDCGTITLAATSTGTPVTVRFSILGPDVNLNKVPGNINSNTYQLLNAKAGVYNVFSFTTYVSTTGGLCEFTEHAQVTVHYRPDFKISTVCASNSTNNSQFYAVTLTDNSSFLASVTPGSRQYKYERKPELGGSWSIIGSGWSTNPNANIASLAPGNYLIRQSIKGSENGIPLLECAKVILLEIPSMNNLNISFLQPVCFDTSVDFEVQNIIASNGDTFLWTFETVGSIVVTNTNPLPSRVFDSSFAGMPVTVTVVVTNKFGCSKTLTSIPVNILGRCFSGTITSSPTNATVCKESPVLLSYLPSTLDNCAPTSYIWMKNNLQVGTSTANSFPVMEPGFYSVIAVNGACQYQSPNVITPIFTPLPTLNLNGPSTLCEGEEAGFSVSTDAIVIQWTIDGNLNTAFNGQTSVSLPNLGLGTHTVLVVATANGCSKTASQTIEVIEPPLLVQLDAPSVVNGDCQAYQIKLSVANPVSGGTYNWSNGANGSSITVTEGGAYMVTYTNAGGCSTSAQIYVPKNPKTYMWIFPTGCYSKCKDEVAFLLGPTLPVNAWAWLLDNNSVSNGVNSAPANYPLTQSGTYNLQLNTGLCNLTSEPMNLTARNCEDCKLEVKVGNLYPNQNGTCSFTLVLIITNNLGVPFQGAVVSNANNLLMVPGTINILPGTHSYSFTIIPINGFLGGNVNMSIIGTIIKDDATFNCSTLFSLNVPACNSNQARPARTEEEAFVTFKNEGDLMLYPNPATNKVNIRFESEQTQSQIEVYDLTGRLMASFESSAKEGVWELDLAPMATGVYVVVLRQGGTILMQRKLQVH